MRKQYEVYFEERGKSKPRSHEERIAKFVANNFESDIVFLKRYSSKTPDSFVLKTNLRWELKSPQGGGKHTIQNNLRSTDGQSENVILDLSRAKLTDEQGISRAREFVKEERSRIKRLKVLTKKQIMVDIKD